MSLLDAALSAPFSSGGMTCHSCSEKDGLLQQAMEKIKKLREEKKLLKDELKARVAASGSGSSNTHTSTSEIERRKNHEIADLHNQIDKLQRQLHIDDNKHRSDIAKLKEEKNNSDSDLHAARKQITMLQKDLKEATSNASASKPSTGTGWGSMLSLGTGSSNHAKEKAMQDQIGILEKSLEQMMHDIRNQALAHEERMIQGAKNLQEAKQNIESLTNQAEHSRTRAERADARVIDIEHQLVQVQTKLNDSTNQIREQDAQLAQLRNDLATSTSRFNELQSDHTELTQQHSTLMAEHHTLMDQLDLQLDSFTHAQSEITNLQATISQQVHQLDDLTTTSVEREGLVHDLRNTIEHLQGQIEYIQASAAAASSNVVNTESTNNTNNTTQIHVTNVTASSSTTTPVPGDDDGEDSSLSSTTSTSTLASSFVVDRLYDDLNLPPISSHSSTPADWLAQAQVFQKLMDEYQNRPCDHHHHDDDDNDDESKQHTNDEISTGRMYVIEDDEDVYIDDGRPFHVASALVDVPHPSASVAIHSSDNVAIPSTHLSSSALSSSPSSSSLPLAATPVPASRHSSSHPPGPLFSPPYMPHVSPTIQRSPTNKSNHDDDHDDETRKDEKEQEKQNENGHDLPSVHHFDEPITSLIQQFNGSTTDDDTTAAATAVDADGDVSGVLVDSRDLSLLDEMNANLADSLTLASSEDDAAATIVETRSIQELLDQPLDCIIQQTSTNRDTMDHRIEQEDVDTPNQQQSENRNDTNEQDEKQQTNDTETMVNESINCDTNTNTDVTTDAADESTDPTTLVMTDAASLDTNSIAAPTVSSLDDAMLLSDPAVDPSPSSSSSPPCGEVEDVLSITQESTINPSQHNTIIEPPSTTMTTTSTVLNDDDTNQTIIRLENMNSFSIPSLPASLIDVAPTLVYDSTPVDVDAASTPVSVPVAADPLSASSIDTVGASSSLRLHSIPCLSSWSLHQSHARLRESHALLASSLTLIDSLRHVETRATLQLTRATFISSRRRADALEARSTATATLEKLADVQQCWSASEFASKQIVEEMGERILKLTEQLAEKDAKGWK